MAKIEPALSWINLIDLPGATFVATSEMANLPASNLADDDMGMPWGVSALSLGSTTFDVDIELAMAGTVGIFVLAVAWRLDRAEKLIDTPMMAPTDTVQVWLDDAVTAFGTGGLDESGEFACNINKKKGYIVWIPDEDVEDVKRIRIRIKVPSRATAGFWWGARAWAGPLKRMIRGHQYGNVEKWDENAFEEMVRTPSVPFQHVKKDELDDMLEFEQFTGKKRQFVFVEDINSPNETAMIGKRPQTSGYQSSYYRNFGFTLQIQESW